MLNQIRSDNKARFSNNQFSKLSTFVIMTFHKNLFSHCVVKVTNKHSNFRILIISLIESFSLIRVLETSRQTSLSNVISFERESLLLFLLFQATVINEFSFLNSIWYSLSSIMQQGSEIAPRLVCNFSHSCSRLCTCP